MRSNKIKNNHGVSASKRYPTFLEWTWVSYDGTKKINPDNFVSQHKEWDFYIGTDSQTYYNKTVYTTAIIAYKKCYGGTIIIHSDKTETYASMRYRLLMEAMRSLEAAFFVNQKILSQSAIAVHLDVSPNLKWESGKYKDELVGMIMSQGFFVSVKPNAWAASSAADRKT